MNPTSPAGQMSLTTPVPKEMDSAFPGENWFFYWKTSASLWKTKLAEFPGSRIIVPINWSMHTETGDQFDFGELRPETHLKKLVDLCAEVGKEMTFFLPLTPAPYLQNGGLPHFLARTLAINFDYTAYGVIDSDDQLIKLYSFYDPRVFEGFSRFVKKLGEYFKEQKIPTDLWAIRCGQFQGGRFRSFLEDRSKMYDQAYRRYLQAKEIPEGGISPIEEKQYAFEFSQSIQKLYLDEAQAKIGVNFEGCLDVAFLGSSTEHFLKRLHHNIYTADYTREIYEALSRDVIPSSVLVQNRMKKGVLGRELNDLVANSYLPLRITNNHYEGFESIHFRPLTFFKVYEKLDGLTSLFLTWEDLKLWSYLKRDFGWSYKIISKETIGLHENSGFSDEHILFFQGLDIDRDNFNYLLKAFMHGGKIVLNKAGLSEEFERRLNAFILENSLQEEKVFLHTDLTNVELGEGRLLQFDGDKLNECSDEQKNDFWEKVVAAFNLIHSVMKGSEGVDYYWRTRSSTSNELKFEEVRRLSLYNPTSYRKKVQFKLSKNFVVYKIIDEINVIVQTFPNEVAVELMPEGSVILDFGVFS